MPIKPFKSNFFHVTSLHLKKDVVAWAISEVVSGKACVRKLGRPALASLGTLICCCLKSLPVSGSGDLTFNKEADHKWSIVPSLPLWHFHYRVSFKKNCPTDIIKHLPKKMPQERKAIKASKLERTMMAGKAIPSAKKINELVWRRGREGEQMGWSPQADLGAALEGSCTPGTVQGLSFPY